MVRFRAVSGQRVGMAARAISSGTISFGLVSIPVKVYTATSSQTLRFNMLDAQHRQRLKQQYVSARSGELVERSQTVRGYEYAKDQYVVLTEEELKALETRSDGTIAIEQFVPIEKVDPIYFEKTTFLGPDKGGQKAYRLLAQAMKESGRVAIGRWNARGRQELVLLRAYRTGLALHTLYYADEVRAIDDVEIDLTIELSDAELTLARQLIDQLSSEAFDPRKYEDEYRKSVLAAIDRKVAGQEIVSAEPVQAREQIIDLVAALKKSLAERSGTADKPGVRKAARSKGGGRARGKSGAK
jgi:DNA end-binding protein Ku